MRAVGNSNSAETVVVRAGLFFDLQSSALYDPLVQQNHRLAAGRCHLPRRARQRRRQAPHRQQRPTEFITFIAARRKQDLQLTYPRRPQLLPVPCPRHRHQHPTAAHEPSYGTCRGKGSSTRDSATRGGRGRGERYFSECDTPTTPIHNHGQSGCHSLAPVNTSK